MEPDTLRISPAGAAQPYFRIEKRYALVLLTVFLAYIASASFGMALFTFGFAPAFIWPPTGIAVAAVILEGAAVWPAIFVAAFFVSLISGLPPLVALLIAAITVLQVLVTVAILKHLSFNPMLSRLRDTFVLMCAAVIGGAISPTLGTISLWLSNKVFGSPLPLLSWGDWWTGMILSVLVFTPLIVRWLIRPTFTRTRLQLLEGGIALGLLVAADILLFWTPLTSFNDIPLVYLLLLPIFWIALRVGPRGMTLALFINAVLTLTGVVFGLHANTAIPLGVRLLQTEIFIIIISVIALISVSIAEERKDATKALKGHISKLEDALRKINVEDRAKNEFIAILAHELRNPLAPLLSSLELMKLQGLGSPEKRRLATLMDGSIKTMARLLDDLLDIARITEKKLKLQMEHVNALPVIEHALETVSHHIKARGHTLTLEQPKDDIRVQADPVRLEQIIVNLLTNASKYTDPGGRIGFTCREKDGRLVLCVKDTGIGIAAHMLDKIFEPFHQIEEGRRSHGGLGIGLSLTKQLVEMHGGTIEAKSEGVGKGSEFIVRLPIVEGARITGNRDRSRSLFKNMRQSFKILVVDDNEPAAEGLSKLLEYRGHTVRLAYNGLEALRIAREMDPQVIVLDIGLPDIEGYEVARQLRGTGSTAVIIALTGYGQEEDKQRAADAGFDYHLTKPVGLPEIEAVLSKFSGERRLFAGVK